MYRQEIFKVTVVFVTLFVLGLGMIVGGYRLASADVQLVFAPVGSAIMGGTLAFYLVQMFALDSAKRR